jgi:hypothetical protein
MKNYKSSTHFSGGTNANNATKEVHILWNEDLECGVIYHTSNKTGKVTKMELQFGLQSFRGNDNSVIPIDKNTNYEDAILMLEQTYSVVKKHLDISK